MCEEGFVWRQEPSPESEDKGHDRGPVRPHDDPSAASLCRYVFSTNYLVFYAGKRSVLDGVSGNFNKLDLHYS